MPNVSSFGAQTDNAVVSGTVTDRQMIIPEIPPQGLMSVGPRVTPNFVKEPWSKLRSYNFFDVVKDVTGSSYIAIKPVVPTNTELTNEEFWFKWSDPDAQINELEEIVKTYESQIAQNKIDIVKSGTYQSIESANVKNDGITDNSDAFNAAVDNVGLKKGVYKIDKDTIINASLTFAQGAVLKISENATVTIKGSIIADCYQIFSGDGNVKLNGFVKPEWFGAKNDAVTDCAPAFNKMLKSIDNSAVIVMQPCENNSNVVPTNKAYMLNSPVTMNHSRVSIYGNYATLIFNALKGFIINSDEESYVEENQIFNLTIYAHEPNSDMIAIDASNTVRCTIEKVEIYMTKKGVIANNTSNLVLNGVYYYADTQRHNASECIGFEMTGINASLRMNESHATDLSPERNKLIGMRLDGLRNKDFIISNCEFNNSLIGMHFGERGIAAIENFDCFIQDTVFDNNTTCLKIENLGSSAKVNVSDCFLLGEPNANALLEINACEGVVVKGCQFVALNSASKKADACVINAGSSILIAENTITNCANGIRTGNGGSGITIANNVFCQDSTVTGGTAVDYETAISSDVQGLIIIGNVSKKTDKKYNIGIDTRSSTAENAIVIGNAISCLSNNLGSTNNQFNLTL